MRIALIFDIHGNLAALETVLHALDREPLGGVVCLGEVAAAVRAMYERGMPHAA